MKPKVAVNGSVCRFVFSSDIRSFTKERPPWCPHSVAYWGIFTDNIKFPDEHKWVNTSRLKYDNFEDGIVLVFDVWILSAIMNTICFHSAAAHSSHRQWIWPEGCQIRSGISAIISCSIYQYDILFAEISHRGSFVCNFPIEGTVQLKIQIQTLSIHLNLDGNPLVKFKVSGSPQLIFKRCCLYTLINLYHNC